MTNTERASEQQPPIGIFSEEELEDYLRVNDITPEQLERSSSDPAFLFGLIERLIGRTLDARIRHLMASFGLGIGAFLIPELDWELVAILEKDKRYMQCLIELDENEYLQSLLTLEERRTLRLFANAYRITWYQFGSDHLLRLSTKTTNSSLFKDKTIPIKNQ